MDKHQTDFDVFDEDGQYIGEITLDTTFEDEAAWDEMPQELEINGFTYKIEV